MGVIGLVATALAVAGAMAWASADDGDGRAVAGGSGRAASQAGGEDGGEEEPTPYFAADNPPPFESIAALASVSRLVVEAEVQGPPEYLPFVEEDQPGAVREMVGSHIYRVRVSEVIARSPEVDVEVGQVIEVAMVAANPALDDRHIEEEVRSLSNPLEEGPTILFLATNDNITLAGKYSAVGSDLGIFTVDGDQLSYRGYGPIADAPVPREELVAAVQADGVLASSLNRDPEPAGPRPPDDGREWTPMEEPARPPAGR